MAKINNQDDYTIHMNKNPEGSTSVRIQPESYNGYVVHLVESDNPAGYRIAMGCRFFTPKEAQCHWSEVSAIRLLPSSKRGGRARAMLRLLPTLHERAVSYGWASGKYALPTVAVDAEPTKIDWTKPLIYTGNAYHWDAVLLDLPGMENYGRDYRVVTIVPKANNPSHKGRCIIQIVNKYGHVLNSLGVFVDGDRNIKNAPEPVKDCIVICTESSGEKGICCVDQSYRAVSRERAEEYAASMRVPYGDNTYTVVQLKD